MYMVGRVKHGIFMWVGRVKKTINHIRGKLALVPITYRNTQVPMLSNRIYYYIILLILLENSEQMNIIKENI